MNKIFGICFSAQIEEIEKYCFNECNKVIIGELRDNILGSLIPYRIENCPYEEKRMALGWTVTTGEPVWLRKLRKVK